MRGHGRWIPAEGSAGAAGAAGAGDRPAVLAEALTVTGLRAADLDGRVLVASRAREAEAEAVRLERKLVAPAVAARRARSPLNGGPR